MEAKELRIGNLIKTDLQYIDTDNDYMDVNGNLICAIEDGDYEGEPIPLTEEWLVKFGFEKINHIGGYSFFSLKRKRKEHKAPSICIYDSYTAVGNNTAVPHCKHVHQLQNLYFALTGEELKLRE